MLKIFTESKNPRINLQHEMKENQNWGEKRAKVTIKPFLTKAKYSKDRLDHMICDGKHLFVAEGFNIFVIDAETLEVLHKLDASLDNLTEIRRGLIRMEADGNFLVAFVRYDLW
jgi:hypothetical protein